MKKYFFLLHTLSFIACFCIAAKPAPDTATCLVTKVIDGDSFVILHQGKLEHCRLANIDAPELTQAFGMLARDSLTKFLEKRSCQLAFIAKDLYGRQIVLAQLNGADAGEFMISRGLAWVNMAYNPPAFLVKLEKDAKGRQLGLWGCVTPIPPWIYRKLNARSKQLYSVCI